jgi:hypothetical protein
MPAGLEEVHSLPLGSASARLLTDRAGCVRLVVQVGSREQRDDGSACPEGEHGIAFRARQSDVRFNDRPRRVPRCPSNADCSGLLPDAMLPATLVYGRVDPAIEAICVSGEQGPAIVRPDALGYFLSRASYEARGFTEPLYFLPGGQLIGPNPDPRPRSIIDACQLLIT